MKISNAVQIRSVMAVMALAPEHSASLPLPRASMTGTQKQIEKRTLDLPSIAA